MLGKATPERLSTFSDGVFAVLIRVLVLDLRPPGSARSGKSNFWFDYEVRVHGS